MNNLPYGVIFDMDGVLLDSEPFIIAAASQMFSELGLSVQPSDFHPFTGTGENRFLGGVAEKYGFDFDLSKGKARTYDIYLDMIKGHLQPLDGVIDFIKFCREQGKRLAVASSADRRKVVGNLSEISLSVEVFDAVLCGNDVSRKKPFPDIFLLASQRLALSPSDCLVIEDAVSGVTAAKACGAKCLAITSSFTQSQLSDADWFAPDLSLVPPEAISW